MRSDFILEYITFLFTEQTRVTSKQLELIASGKRTPSNLFTAEKNELHELFNSSLNFNESDWEACLDTLVKNEILINESGIHSISPIGLEKKKEFHKQYPFITKVKTLTHLQTRKEFWSWFVFVSQILSEFSYKNNRYIPYTSDYSKQIAIKKWLSRQLSDAKKLSHNWASDISVFLTCIPDHYRYFLLDQFTGHDYDGLTRRQLSEKYEIEDSAIDIIVSHLMHQLYINREKMPLLHSLWDEAHVYYHNGLSESAWKSMKLLEKNYSIDQVSRIRKLKENTIKEHILERVLVNPEENGSDYVPDMIQNKLDELFEEYPDLTYKEARMHIESLEFFWFRLMEIERIRVIKCHKN